jgi:hypothetical protein
MDFANNREHRATLLRAIGYETLSQINSISVVMPASLVGTVLLTLRGRVRLSLSGMTGGFSLLRTGRGQVRADPTCRLAAGRHYRSRRARSLVPGRTNGRRGRQVR